MKTKTAFLLFALALGAGLLGRTLWAQAPAVAPAAGTATSGVVRIELPPETAAYRPGAGMEQAQALCLTCHSADYVGMQPPMPRKFWEANVKKMKEKYGAPMPEDVTGLVDYLTTAYGVK